MKQQSSKPAFDSAIVASETSSPNDFDFLIGKWKVHNRILKTRLNNSNEWIELEAFAECRKILSGFGNIDSFQMVREGKPHEGMALRLFNPKTRLWSIYWANSDSVVLDVPQVGSFENRVGRFYARDVFEEKEIIVLYSWDATKPDVPSWSQAFSTDNGRTWEWNWYMTFHRRHEGKAIDEREDEQTGFCCPIVELRQYTLHPGKRDILIDLFDREFVESQEAVGMTIIGQFRDLDNPNRFVWLRGFQDMPSRARALTDFYGGPVWKAHREAANATMIDSGNVLLLRPARSRTGFSLRNHRPRVGAKADRKGVVIATIYYFEAPVSEDFVTFFDGTLKPVLEDTGASILGYFVTEASTNTFPRLPVREGENVFVWLSHFQDLPAYEDHQASLTRLRRWKDQLWPELTRRLKGKPEVLKLIPTKRSHLY